MVLAAISPTFISPIRVSIGNTFKYAIFIEKYNIRITIVPIIRAKGRFFLGFLISPAAKVTYSHPPTVQFTATKAIPIPVSIDPILILVGFNERSK